MRGVLSRFSIDKRFVLQCRKDFYGNTSVLRLRKFPVAKNSMDNKGGYQDFPSKFFCLTMPKTFARKLFCVVFQKTSGSEKDYG